MLPTPRMIPPPCTVACYASPRCLVMRLPASPIDGRAARMPARVCAGAPCYYYITLMQPILRPRTHARPQRHHSGHTVCTSELPASLNAPPPCPSLVLRRAGAGCAQRVRPGVRRAPWPAALACTNRVTLGFICCTCARRGGDRQTHALRACVSAQSWHGRPPPCCARAAAAVETAPPRQAPGGWC